MGLICSSRLLDLAPALIESIKTAGLVLIMDISDADVEGQGELGTGPALRPVGPGAAFGIARPRTELVGYKGVDGVLRASGVLRFNESVDM